MPRRGAVIRRSDRDRISAYLNAPPESKRELDISRYASKCPMCNKVFLHGAHTFRDSDGDAFCSACVPSSMSSDDDDAE